MEVTVAATQMACSWDIGANVGSVCLPVAGGCPNTRVHAFEPSPARAPLKPMAWDAISRAPALLVMIRVTCRKSASRP